MLGMAKYDREYIDACKARVKADLAAYRGLKTALAKQPPNEQLTSALQDLETAFFNNLAMLLDYFFVHRLRGTEGKDGNPMNEVRVLSNSMMQNGGVLATSYPGMQPSAQGDKSIKLVPDKTILKHQLGEEIRLTEEEFARLSEAYFDEIERKFAA